MMLMSSDFAFKPELFLWPQNYEENLFVDRKQDLYGLFRDNRKKSDFVRDMIAMANTARHFGRPAYILLGIDDEGHIVGLEKELLDNNLPLNHVNTWEKIRQMASNILREYIAPPPICQLKHGSVDGKQVAYFLIEPASHPLFYRVKKSIKAGKKSIAPGEAWIRYGESNMEIEIHSLAEGNYLSLSYKERINIFPRQLVRYFEELLGGRNITESYHIIGYQDLYTSSGESIQDVYDRFVNQDDSNILVVIGDAGIGKTSSVRRFVFELAQAGKSAAQTYVREERFILPDVYVPVVIPLWSLQNISSSSKFLENVVLSQINRTGRFTNDPPHVLSPLLRENIRWLVCFDGLDEIWSIDGQREFIKALYNFSREFPRIKIILLSRPYHILTNFLESEYGESWITVTIQPFTDEQIINFIITVSSSTYTDNVDNLYSTIINNEDMKRICSYPAFLNYALQELVGAYVEHDHISLPEDISDDSDADNRPRVGIILDSIYRGVWKREENRRQIDQVTSSLWWEATGKLSLTLGRYRAFYVSVLHEIMGTSEQSPEFWLLNLNVLKEHTDRRPVHYLFFTENTQAYFGATLIDHLLNGHISGSPDIASAKEWLTKCTSEFHDKVLSMLQDISPYKHLIESKGGTA